MPSKLANKIMGKSSKNLYAERANRNPVASSTMGYCREILVPQFLHFPELEIKLSTGTSSRQVRMCEQEKHRERPLTIDLPVFNRKITTLRKLPTNNPKSPINITQV